MHQHSPLRGLFCIYRAISRILSTFQRSSEPASMNPAVMLVQVDGSDGHFLTGTAFRFVRRARGAQDAEGLVQQITELVHDLG